MLTFLSLYVSIGFVFCWLLFESINWIAKDEGMNAREWWCKQVIKHTPPEAHAALTRMSIVVLMVIVLWFIMVTVIFAQWSRK